MAAFVCTDTGGLADSFALGFTVNPALVKRRYWCVAGIPRDSSGRADWLPLPAFLNDDARLVAVDGSQVNSHIQPLDLCNPTGSRSPVYYA